MSSSRQTEQAEKEVKTILQKINRAWTTGHLAALGQYFHGDMVIQGPKFQDAIKGKDKCVKHYEDFAVHTNIKKFGESEYKVNVWEATAVASYKYDIEYEVEGETRQESGHELYAFSREGNTWKAVWQTIIPLNS